MTLLYLQVFREYFPVNEDFVILECVWESDKFILIEKNSDSENASKSEDCGGSISVQAPSINYKSIESCLGGKNLDDIYTLAILPPQVRNTL